MMEARVRAIACVAAVIGIALFTLAGVAVMGRVIGDEQFWLFSAIGLAFYGAAHAVGARTTFTIARDISSVARARTSRRASECSASQVSRMDPTSSHSGTET